MYDKQDVKAKKKERDELIAQNKELASLNYASEPEFVRNRMRLHEIIEDINSLKITMITRRIRPLMEKLTNTEKQLQEYARASEEDSEQVSEKFLSGNISYDEFVKQYINSRKQVSKRRVLADRFLKEKILIESNVPKLDRGQSYMYSPVPPQRKRRAETRTSMKLDPV